MPQLNSMAIQEQDSMTVHEKEKNLILHTFGYPQHLLYDSHRYPQKNFNESMEENTYYDTLPVVDILKKASSVCLNLTYM